MFILILITIQKKYIKFPIEEGWNNLFKFFTDGIEIKYNTKTIALDFSPEDMIVCTTEVDKFSGMSNYNMYSYGSFDIDSTPYKEGSPDTIIYPNHTPFLTMTQFGRYFTRDKYNNPYEKKYNS